MTVATTGSRISYTGNGSTTAFAFPYLFLANADLKVYVDGTLKTLTTDYTVTGAGAASGGTVTFGTAPASTKAVVIICDPDLLQSTDLPSNGPFPASSVEAMSDKSTLQAQRLKDRVDRAAIFPDSYAGAASPLLPVPGAGYYIRWNSNGTALEAVSAVNDSGSFLASGTGAVSISVNTKLDETKNVLSYGSITVLADRASLQAAIDAAGYKPVIVSVLTELDGPVDVKDAKLIIQRKIRAKSTWAARTMADGRSVDSLLYLGGRSGLDRGGRVVGVHDSDDNYDLDASDSTGVARAKHCIEIDSNAMDLVSDLLVRRAKESNVRWRGNGFMHTATRIYSAHSPVGFDLSFYDTVLSVGVQTTMALINCYAVSCAKGFFSRAGSTIKLIAGAADSCDYGIYAQDNGRVVADCFNFEQTVRPVYCNAGRVVLTGDGLINNIGTSAYAADKEGSDTESGTGGGSNYYYSGRAGKPGATPGVYEFDVTDGDLTVQGVLDSSTNAMVEFAIKANANSRVDLGQNWCNYPTLPPQGYVQARVNSLSTSRWTDRDLIVPWTAPAYSAGDYTASGAMTWTVEAGDVTEIKYTIDPNKRMTVKFAIEQTSVGGVASDTLKIAIPASKTAAAPTYNPVHIVDNGTATTGYATVATAGTTINIKRTNGANFAGAANTTAVYGEITFDIQ